MCAYETKCRPANGIERRVRGETASPGTKSAPELTLAGTRSMPLLEEWTCGDDGFRRRRRRCVPFDLHKLSLRSHVKHATLRGSLLSALKQSKYLRNATRRRRRNQSTCSVSSRNKRISSPERNSAVLCNRTFNAIGAVCAPFVKIWSYTRGTPAH